MVMSRDARSLRQEKPRGGRSFSAAMSPPPHPPGGRKRWSCDVLGKKNAHSSSTRSTSTRSWFLTHSRYDGSMGTPPAANKSAAMKGLIVVGSIGTWTSPSWSRAARAPAKRESGGKFLRSGGRKKVRTRLGLTARLGAVGHLVGAVGGEEARRPVLQGATADTAPGRNHRALRSERMNDAADGDFALIMVDAEAKNQIAVADGGEHWRCEALRSRQALSGSSPARRRDLTCFEIAEAVARRPCSGRPHKVTVVLNPAPAKATFPATMLGAATILTPNENEARRVERPADAAKAAARALTR